MHRPRTSSSSRLQEPVSGAFPPVSRPPDAPLPHHDLPEVTTPRSPSLRDILVDVAHPVSCRRRTAPRLLRHSDDSPIASSTRAIAPGSWIAASTRRTPEHFGHTSTSIPNARCSNSAHEYRRRPPRRLPPPCGTRSRARTRRSDCCLSNAATATFSIPSGTPPSADSAPSTPPVAPCRQPSASPSSCGHREPAVRLCPHSVQVSSASSSPPDAARASCACCVPHVARALPSAARLRTCRRGPECRTTAH